MRMLREQTARLLNASMPECVCLVALLPEAQQVLATCDIRPPENVAGQHPAGVPLAEQHAAYVTNVAVDSKTRGQGLGYQLLEAAAALAYEKWQAQALYTTVDSTNKVTFDWSMHCPFHKHAYVIRLYPLFAVSAMRPAFFQYMLSMIHMPRVMKHCLATPAGRC